MAAIDPSAAPAHTGTANGNTPVRATLKLVYDPRGPGSENDSEDDSEDEGNILKALLEARGSEDEDEGEEDDEEDDEPSSDDEEKNGGPSDPSKTKKARQEAAMQQMMKALAESQSGSEDDLDMEDAPRANGLASKAKLKSKSNKGKGKALAEDLDGAESEEDGEGSPQALDEQVVCTLDPEKVRDRNLALIFRQSIC